MRYGPHSATVYTTGLITGYIDSYYKFYPTVTEWGQHPRYLKDCQHLLILWIHRRPILHCTHQQMEASQHRPYTILNKDPIQHPNLRTTNPTPEMPLSSQIADDKERLVCEDADTHPGFAEKAGDLCPFRAFLMENVPLYTPPSSCGT